MEFIRNYNLQSRPEVLELLEKYADKNIVTFKSRREEDEYVARSN